MTGSYIDADPVTIALNHLKQSERFLAVAGSVDHISGEREGPWPHVRVRPGVGGTAGHYLRGTWAPDVDIEVWDHPDGRLGLTALRDIAVVALEVLYELNDAPYVPGQPIIYGVSATTLPQERALANGQGRYFLTVAIQLRPAG